MTATAFDTLKTAEMLTAAIAIVAAQTVLTVDLLKLPGAA